MAIKPKSKVYPVILKKTIPQKKPYTTKYRKPAQNMCGLIKYPLSIYDLLKIILTR